MLVVGAEIASAVEPRPETRSSQSLLGGAFCWLLDMGATGYNQTQHDQLKTRIITEIERYANIGQFDYSSNESLGSGYIFPFFSSFNPGFYLTEWMIKLFTAYDYLGGIGTSTTIDNWFGDFADYCYLNSIDEYDDKIPGRLTRDYSSINTAGYAGDLIGSMWEDSNINVYGLNGIYNNRMVPYLRFLAMYAIMYDNGSYQNYCKLWWKEFVAFGCTGDCDWHEYQRGRTQDPEAVTRYCGVSVGSLAWVADRDWETNSFHHNLQ